MAMIRGLFRVLLAGVMDIRLHKSGRFILVLVWLLGRLPHTVPYRLGGFLFQRFLRDVSSDVN